MTEHSTPPESSSASMDQARQLANELSELTQSEHQNSTGHRRTSPLDHRHIREREALAAAYNPTNTVFGQSTLAYIDQVRIDHADNPDYAQALIARELEGARRVLTQTLIYRSPRSEPPPEVATVSNFNLDQYEDFLRNHTAQVQTEIDRLEPEIANMRASFMARLQAKIEAAEYPITLEEATRRLDRVRIVLIDPWERDKDISQPIVEGDHYYATGEVYLRLGSSLEQMQAILDHELLHALQGVTAKIDEVQIGLHQDIHIKSGLSIPTSPEDARTRRRGRFSWLNEAVTEHLAMDIGNRSTGLYEKDRTVFELLAERVSASSFYAAYFEDFEPDQGTPAWGNLQNELNKQFEPGILVTLDNIIAKHGEDGLNQAANYLRKLMNPQTV